MIKAILLSIGITMLNGSVTQVNPDVSGDYVVSVNANGDLWDYFSDGTEAAGQKATIVLYDNQVVYAF